MTTDAPGMTAPIGSVTMPLILEVVSTCAIVHTKPTTAIIQNSNPHFKTNRYDLPARLIPNLPAQVVFVRIMPRLKSKKPLESADYRPRLMCGLLFWMIAVVG